MRRFIPIVNVGCVALLLACLVGGSACTFDPFACVDPDPDRTKAYSCDDDEIVCESYRSGGSGAHCFSSESRTACTHGETCAFDPHRAVAAFCVAR